jgi:hypothetical protein
MRLRREPLESSGWLANPLFPSPHQGRFVADLPAADLPDMSGIVIIGRADTCRGFFFLYICIG